MLENITFPSLNQHNVDIITPGGVAPAACRKNQISPCDFISH
jgi:hypothetical protein